jgi:hypothetical protein
MITCTNCNAQKEVPLAKSGKPRTPKGWKVINEKTYCIKCKSKLFALRAVTIPVAKTDWDKLMPVLWEAWKDVTRCANYLISTFYVNDKAILTKSEKLGTWERPYLYPQCREQFPSIEPTALVSLINTVQAKYSASRFDLWRNKTSLPTFRDIPLPINSQSWYLNKDEQGNRVFEFRYNRERYNLELRSDKSFHYQHKSLDKIVNGVVEAGEAALYKHDKSLMLKIAGYFEVSKSNGTQNFVKARTTNDGFLIATSSTGREWKLNGDQIQHWIVGYAKQQQRLREDLKAERRFPKHMREGIVSRMGKVAEYRKNQVNSWMHESSHQLVMWTKRQHAVSLTWDDSYKSSMPTFPWFVFGKMIEDKCKMQGIEFVKESEGETLKSA